MEVLNMKTKHHLDMHKSEISIQRDIFLFHWNNYPNERGLLCYNLNNSANKIQGNQNKSLGLIKGRSDMVYYKNGEATMLEIKTDNGKQSKAQKDWETTIKNAGFDYIILRSLQDFKDFLNGR
jgi:hypothetical protein